MNYVVISILEVCRCLCALLLNVENGQESCRQVSLVCCQELINLPIDPCTLLPNEKRSVFSDSMVDAYDEMWLIGVVDDDGVVKGVFGGVKSDTTYMISLYCRNNQLLLMDEWPIFEHYVDSVSFSSVVYRDRYALGNAWSFYDDEGRIVGLARVRYEPVRVDSLDEMFDPNTMAKVVYRDTVFLQYE